MAKKINKVKEDIRKDYLLVRKIIKSKILSKREASDLAVMFTEAYIEKLPKRSLFMDDMYNKLLDLNAKNY